MGIIENVLTGMGEKIPYEPCYKAILYGEGTAFFENVRGIKTYSPDEIELLVKRGCLIVRGKEMYIKKYCSGDVVVCGKIFSVERA